MRNTDAARQLKEAWNRHLDNYDKLLQMYKDQGYIVRRNDKTGEHIVENNASMDMFVGTPFESLFKGGK